MSSVSWPAARKAKPNAGPAESAPERSDARGAPTLTVSSAGTPRPISLPGWLGALIVGLALPRTSGALAL
eukprot:8534099-Lingulodinium_polyedra.AAC.1